MAAITRSHTAAGVSMAAITRSHTAAALAASWPASSMHEPQLAIKRRPRSAASPCGSKGVTKKAPRAPHPGRWCHAERSRRCLR